LNSHISSWQSAAPVTQGSFCQPEYLVESAWLEHGPFLAWLIEVLRPECFVELGCHTGYSYFTACQSVKRLGLPTSCYAVDTWRGDEHSGFYGEEVFDAVKTWNDGHYRAFSQLIRATFAEALHLFPDQSIALLHIDGRHFYSDVAADFEAWETKLTSNAIVLFHDTNVRDRDFGVWKFFGELSLRFPTFEFLHGSGLGVVAVGAVPPQLAPFLGGSSETVAFLRAAYSALGEAVSQRWKLRELSATLNRSNAAFSAAEANVQALTYAVREADRRVADQQAALISAEANSKSLADGLAALQSEKAYLQDQNAVLEAQNLERQAEKADLEAQLEHVSQAGRLDVKRRDCQEQRIRQALGQAEKLRFDVVELERRVNHLDGEVARRQELIDAMYASTSWRVSGPVRWAGIRLATLIRKARTVRSLYRRVGGLSGFVALGLDEYRLQRASGAASALRAPVIREMAVHEDRDPYEDIARQMFAEQQAEIDRIKAIASIGEFARRPLISVIMPVYTTPLQWLRRAIESLQEQYYENWELCVVDDCSPSDEQRNLLEAMATDDSRIRLQVMEKNSGISAASNVALAMARGEFVALLDHDDELTKDALYWIASEINSQPDADFIYTDECKIDAAGDRLFHFIFKPDWSPEVLFNSMLTGHLTVYKTNTVRDIGGFRSKYDFSQDYDLALRMSEVAHSVVHVERILYLWRAIPGSAASGGKSYARESNVAALNDALRRRSIPGVAIPLEHANCVRVELPDEPPLVSIIIPSDSIQNLRTALDAIRARTSYPNFEVLVVCNGPLAERLKDEYIDVPQFAFVHYNKKYNFSDKCNEGAQAANGKFVVFFNDDVCPAQPDWIERLIEFLYVPGVEGVSPQLLHENDTIQYAGMISGTPGLVGTAYNNIPRDSGDSFLTMHRYVRDVSVLSGACCALRRDVFLRVGGFDALNTPDGHSDMDLSYKLVQAGFRCVYTPYSVLYHIGNHSWHARSGKYKADIFMLKRWGAYVSRDPHFTASMKRVLYRDFPFYYRIFASHIDPEASYEGPDILFVSHELSLTGAPRMLLYAAATVRERGGFPVVVAPMDGPIRAELEAAGIVVIVDASMRDGHFLFERFARNFETVVVNTLALANVVEQLRAIHGLDVVWWVHEAQAIEKEAAIRKIAGSVNVRLFCNSKYSRGYFPADVRASVLHYGVPDRVVDVSTASRPERMTFVVSGTLEHRKAQDIFVEAVALLPDHVRESCQFLITGTLWEQNRPYWEAVQASMATLPEVKYLGLLAHHDMLDLIARSDMLVCCSRDEPFSLVVMEAAMFGKPSLLSTNVGAGDVLGPERACGIFESGNAAALAELMLDAFEDRDAVARMGHAARRVFEREFTLEAFSERFSQIVLGSTVVIQGAPT